MSGTMTGLNQSQELKQQLKLTPAEIQVARMVEVPGCEMRQTIDDQLQENPLLEEDCEDRNNKVEEKQMQDDTPSKEEDDAYENPLKTDDFDYGDYVNDDENLDDVIGGYGGLLNNEEQKETPIVVKQSFGEYLKSQVYLTKMNKEERHIAKFIIGNLDENGFLKRDSQQLSDDLLCLESLDVPVEKIEDIVQQIKQFDPVGVAAKDLQDCLLIQLKKKDQTDEIRLATTIVGQYFENLSKHQGEYICQNLQISSDAYRDTIEEITKLNPIPSKAWEDNSRDLKQRTYMPDFEVENRDGELIVQLVKYDIPKLRISRHYQQMAEDLVKKQQDEKLNKSERQTASFIRTKMESANQFLQAINQRNEILLWTMCAIVIKQKDFFLDGDESSLKPLVIQDITRMITSQEEEWKPMVLQDIAVIRRRTTKNAEETSKKMYDSSMISRVTKSKYVRTEYGTFPLRFFFSEKMNTAQGEEVSTRKIKNELMDLIKNEDKHAPLTDDQLALKMQEKNYSIARRTVAKYRELYSIPSARMRKEI